MAPLFLSPPERPGSSPACLVVLVSQSQAGGCSWFSEGYGTCSGLPREVKGDARAGSPGLGHPAVMNPGISEWSPWSPRKRVGTQLARSAKSSECGKALWAFLNWAHPISPSLITLLVCSEQLRLWADNSDLPVKGSRPGRGDLPDSRLQALPLSTNHHWPPRKISAQSQGAPGVPKAPSFFLLGGPSLLFSKYEELFCIGHLLLFCS